MGQSLEEIAQKLKSTDKKVQLIYAFNGTGKTRLSREFKELVAPKNIEGDEDAEDEQGIKVLYYNAFTEDLFYWDNDLDADVNRKLIIRPNGFTDLVLQVLREQGLDGNIISNFQHYTSNKLTHDSMKITLRLRFRWKEVTMSSLKTLKFQKEKKVI